MAKLYNVLIVDDHPFIIQGYKNTLDSYAKTHQETFQYISTQASNCKEGYELIKNPPQQKPFDIAFFDISMPAFDEKDIRSGEDLAKLIQKEMPNCIVVLLTMHTELIKINNIVKEINPQGLVIKNDLTFEELLFALHKLFNGENYYSQTVVKFISQSKFQPIPLDPYDEQILYRLSRGTKTKDIPLYVPLSLSAIEKRKNHLKELLEIKDGNDVDLIRVAKEKGII